MFNLKKEEKQTPPISAAGNEVNMRTVPVHTMQDDLDILGGKKPQAESGYPIDASSNSEFKNGSGSFFDNDRRSNNASGNSSPFLNGASPTPQKNASGENVASPEMSNDTSVEPKNDITSVVGKNLSTPQIERKSVLGKILFIAAIVIVVAAFAFGGYYFWTTRVSNNQASITDESEAAPDQVSSPETVSETNTKSPAEIIQSKFSESNPNYLPIDIGTTTADGTNKLFINKASEIKDSGSLVPIEFVVTDMNNDPVSFSAFNYISGMKFPVSILTNLGDKFSLYFFNDNENMRMGLTVELKDKEKIISAIKNEENSLAGDLSPLFMGTAVKSAGKIFKSSTYNNFSIRYNNLDEQGLISIDYSITDKYLTIGTSKQALRSILDKTAK